MKIYVALLEEDSFFGPLVFENLDAMNSSLLRFRDFFEIQKKWENK